jgi:plasmid stability protein
VANLTIALDDEVLRRVRIRALERGVSVNALLRDYLMAFSGSRSSRVRAVALLIELAERSANGRGEETWSRDELHER